MGEVRLMQMRNGGTKNQKERKSLRFQKLGFFRGDVALIRT